MRHVHIRSRSKPCYLGFFRLDSSSMQLSIAEFTSAIQTKREDRQLHLVRSSEFEQDTSQSILVKVPVRRAKAARRDETLELPRHMAPECREVIGVLACRFSVSLMAGEHQSNELEPPWTCLRGGLISGNNAVGCRSSDGCLYKTFVQEHDIQFIKLLHPLYNQHSNQ